ncbi:MAG: 5-(carboxyamino)imidazole ribonucleotide mutase [Magnetococcus sp. WYHC-3]
MIKSPVVGVMIGSDSDWEVMKETAIVLKEFGIFFEFIVSSAHRTPERTHAYASTARERGLKCLIVGAGAAAHLAGVVASKTNLPVIGVPLASTDLNGMDALLSTVQMPAGMPVATMAIGKAGARNAAILAAQILSLGDTALAQKLRDARSDMVRAVEGKSTDIQDRVNAILG